MEKSILTAKLARQVFASFGVAVIDVSLSLYLQDRIYIPVWRTFAEDKHVTALALHRHIFDIERATIVQEDLLEGDILLASAYFYQIQLDSDAELEMVYKRALLNRQEVSSLIATIFRLEEGEHVVIMPAKQAKEGEWLPGWYVETSAGCHMISLLSGMKFRPSEVIDCEAGEAFVSTAFVYVQEGEKKSYSFSEYPLYTMSNPKPNGLCT